MSDIKLQDLIGFDYKTGGFTIGTHKPNGEKLGVEASRGMTQADVDAFLASLSRGGPNAKEEHALLAETIAGPIFQTLPYIEMYDGFYMTQDYGPLEDNRIAIEDVQVFAWETHPDGQILYTRPGFTFTRPSFTQFDSGIELPWRLLEKAGWNVLARSMKAAMWEIARKRDQLARNTLIAAIPASHEYNSASVLLKTVVDEVLADQAAIGYPVTRALINPGTFMQMVNFNWGGTNNNGFFLAPEDARSLIRTLVISDYGGVNWVANPFAPANEVIFSSTPDTVGWHQTRGEAKTSSDVNITTGTDLHAIRDKEHAYYVAHGLSLARIRIG